VEDGISTSFGLSALSPFLNFDGDVCDYFFSVTHDEKVNEIS
tara:strand:+ start:297 stop:422 length:126 start_codon:yes stop_codon:yes gene_type:complete